jgi:hypothetical protein
MDDLSPSSECSHTSINPLIGMCVYVCVCVCVFVLCVEWVIVDILRFLVGNSLRCIFVTNLCDVFISS